MAAPLVAPALVALLWAIALTLLALIGIELLKPSLRRMAESIPSVAGVNIGGAIARATDATAGRVVRWSKAVIAKQVRWFPDYLRHLILVVTAVPYELVQWGLDLTATFHRLGDLLFRYSPALPERLWGAIPRHAARLDRHTRSIDDILTDSLPRAFGSIADLRGDLFRDVAGAGRGWVWRLGDAVDGLSHRLFNVATGVIWRMADQIEILQHSVAVTLPGQIGQLDDALRDLRDRVLGGIAAGLADVRTRVEGLEGWRTETAAVVGAILAAMSIAELTDSLSILRRNRFKLERQCMLDLDEMDDLLALFPVALSMALVVEIVRDGSLIVGAMNEVQEKVIRGGTSHFE